MRETVFDLPSLEQKILDLTVETLKEGFWADIDNAKKTNQLLAAFERKLKLWNQLLNDVESISELVDFYQDGSPELVDLEKEYLALKNQFEKAKTDLYLGGEFDNRNAIMEIKAGAGGTEAQDWSEMLLRMYLRFAERMDFKAEILEKSEGVEAGIKSALLEISGPYAYGFLQSEKGAHRLVRQSPFNAKNLRQTSFAGIVITPALEDTDAEDIQVEEKDIRVDTFRASGAGGQHINKTDSAIRITHVPTGIVVSCQTSRSQHQNREKAMQILRARLAEREREKEEKKAAEARGETVDAAWGNQIRSYVLHPYKMVKDLRTGYETSDTEGVLDGDIEEFCRQYLQWKAEKNSSQNF